MVARPSSLADFPLRWIGALGLGMSATHNLLAPINPVFIWEVLMVVELSPQKIHPTR